MPENLRAPGTIKFYFKNVDLAQWYFRLNGFLTIPNYIIHQSVGPGTRTDIDILGIRFPYRAELSTIKDDSHWKDLKKSVSYLSK